MASRSGLQNTNYSMVKMDIPSRFTGELEIIQTRYDSVVAFRKYDFFPELRPRSSIFLFRNVRDSYLESSYVYWASLTLQDRF